MHKIFHHQKSQLKVCERPAAKITNKKFFAYVYPYTSMGMEVIFISNALKLKIVELANSVDPDEAAHDELSHLGLHCLLPSL